MTMTHKLKTLLTLSLILSCAACAAEVEGDTTQTHSPPVCQADADCAPGLMCRLAYCSATATTTRQLEFTFLPSNNSGYLPQRTSALTINPQDELAFELLPSLKVEGAISRSDDPQPVTGTLIFERSEEQSKERLYTRQSSVRQGQFQAELVPGLYDVTFLPEDDALPQRTWKSQRFELNSDFTRALPVPRTISGNVLYREPLSDPNSPPRFVQEAKVVAVSRETGELSTIGQTDEQGYFTLNVWPDSGVYDLVVSPSSATALVPRVVFEAALDTNGPNTTQSLNLGEFSSQGAEVFLALPESLQEQLDFSPADLRVILRAPLGKGTLQLSTRFAQVGVTGDDLKTPWVLGLKLLPLEYEIELIPPASSRFARTILSRDLRLATKASEVTLESKAPFSAQLLQRSASGDYVPAAQAEVYLSPRAQEQAKTTSSSEMLEPILAKTDDQGRFYTHVELRDYDVEVVPRSSPGQPRAFYTLTADELMQEQALIWRLPAPVVLVGTVFDEQYQGQADLAIEVHELTNGERRLVAQGQTKRQGTFKLILPDTTSAK